MQEVQKFMHQFLRDAVDCGLGKWLARPDTGYYSDDSLRDANKKLMRLYDFSVELGLYRTVFVFNDFDWVLKIPQLTRFSEKPNDCIMENLIYQLSKRMGFDKFFAAAAELVPFECEWGTIPVYVMKKVYVDTNRVSDHFYSLYNGDSEDDDDVEIWYNDNFDEITAVTQAFLDYYGDKEADRLFQFLNFAKVDDLHCGNVGYDEDDNLVIIDYAGCVYEDDEFMAEREANFKMLMGELKKKAEKPIL